MQCELKNISIHYESVGAGRPLLLLHGWTSCLQDMMHELEPLFENRPGWQRIYLDAPGHGLTPGPEWVKGQDQFLEVALAFIEAEIPGRRFALAGVSAGAYLARGIAYHLAARMDGLMLVVPLIVPEDARRDRPVSTVLIADPGLADDLLPDEVEILPMLVKQTREVVARLRSAAQTGGQGGDPDFLSAIRTDPARYGFSFDVDNLSAPFPAPALFITGRQDAWVGYRDAWNILENYPRATFAVLDCAGHFLGWEQPELYRTLVEEWLDRVKGYQESR